MEKYTSGPWATYFARTMVTIRNPDGRLIAYIDAKTDEQKANAKLMANAPNMLNALKIAEKELSGRKGKFWLGVIREAILKAEDNA